MTIYRFPKAQGFPFRVWPQGKPVPLDQLQPSALDRPFLAQTSVTLGIYGGFHKWGYTQIIHLAGIFSINQPFGGIPFMESPIWATNKLTGGQGSREWTWDVQICVKTFKTDGGPPSCFVAHSMEVPKFGHTY